MPAKVTEEDLYAALATETGMTAQDWRDFTSLPQVMQLRVAEGYAAMSWAKSPDKLPKILEILGLIGTIAGVITGVGGAIGAIAALKAVL